MDVFDLMAKLSLDDSEYTRALKNAEGQASSFSSKASDSAKNVDSSFKDLSNTTKGMSGPFGSLRSAIERVTGSSTAQKNMIAQLKSEYKDSKNRVAALTSEYNRTVKETGLMSDESKNLAKALKEAKGESKALESEIDELGDEAKNTGADFSSFGSKIGTAFKVIAGAAVAGVGAAVAGVTALTKKSIDAYADYEQLLGGVQKLYGNMGLSLEEYAQQTGQTAQSARSEWENLEKAQTLVLENAKNAYKTAGVSANEYMESATSFSAALIKSLNGDTVAAANQTDVAMRAISDNWNTFGGDIESIQTAYQGFAKQNYTIKLMSVA